MGRGGTQHTDLFYYIYFQECSLDFVNLQWLAEQRLWNICLQVEFLMGDD